MSTLEFAMSNFPPDAPPPLNLQFHAGRREALANQMSDKTAAIIIGGTGQIRNGDTEHPYRPGNNLFYFSGFEEPESVGVLEKDTLGSHTFTLIVPPNDPDKEIWNGKRAGVAGAVRDFCADHAEDTSQLERVLKKVAESAKEIFFISSDTNSKLNEKVTDTLGTTQNWAGKVTEMRLVKTEEELARIQRAIDITAEGYKKMMTFWPEGTNEGKLQAIHEYEIRSRGAVRLAFPTIVASGNNATTLHYDKNTATIKPGDLVLVDSGAEYGNYSADITRTWPISGKFSKEQRELYEIVYNAQEAVMKMFRPGVSLSELHEESERVIEEGLRNLGILAQNSTKEELRRYFPHYFGHHMGLDVHDGCDGTLEWAVLKQQKLQPNMVITNEPGIYIPEDDLVVDEKWRGIGIRIEDDILVTENGCVNLTSAVPRHPDEIEKIFVEASN